MDKVNKSSCLPAHLRSKAVPTRGEGTGQQGGRANTELFLLLRPSCLVPQLQIVAWKEGKMMITPAVVSSRDNWEESDEEVGWPFLPSALHAPK